MAEFSNFNLDDFVAHANERQVGIERYKKRFGSGSNYSHSETWKQNDELIQVFTDKYFKEILCSELGIMASKGKTRGVISLYCDEMNKVVETLQNNRWPSMCPNKLILKCMLNISKTDKFEKIFFKVYTDEDYKVLVNLKGKEDEDEIRKNHYERIAKERHESGFGDDFHSKLNNIKGNEHNDIAKETVTPKRIDSEDLEAVISSIGITDE